MSHKATARNRSSRLRILIDPAFMRGRPSIGRWPRNRNGHHAEIIYAKFYDQVTFQWTREMVGGEMSMVAGIDGCRAGLFGLCKDVSEG